MFERAATASDLPVLDEGYLGRLAGHVGPAVLADLAADGLLELAGRLNRLEELLTAGDLDAIARMGHDLVGMAGHLGLARLSAAAAEMNRAARSDDEAKTSPRAMLRFQSVTSSGRSSTRRTKIC